MMPAWTGLPPDLRQAISADADHPTPLIIDLHLGQLREHFQHFRPHVTGDVLRVAPGIVTSAAEQQTPIGRETVVVQRYPLIADRHVLWQQRMGLGFAQGFGGDDVATGRQHFAAELRIEFVEVGVAAQH